MNDSVSRIREIMNDRSLTSKDLSAKIGVQASTISHYFTGRNSPSAAVLNKILATFPDINPDWLFRGIPPKYLNYKANTGNKTETGTLFPNYDDNQAHQPSPVNTQKREDSTYINVNNSASAATATANANNADNVRKPTKIESAPAERFVSAVLSHAAPAKTITRIVVYYSDNTYEDFVSR